MSCDIWLKEDIQNIILAAEQACASAVGFQLSAIRVQGKAESYLMAYRKGYRDALKALAIAFGLAEKSAVSPEPFDAGWPEERPESLIISGDGDRRAERRILR